MEFKTPSPPGPMKKAKRGRPAPISVRHETRPSGGLVQVIAKGFQRLLKQTPSVERLQNQLLKAKNKKQQLTILVRYQEALRRIALSNHIQAPKDKDQLTKDIERENIVVAGQTFNASVCGTNNDAVTNAVKEKLRDCIREIGELQSEDALVDMLLRACCRTYSGGDSYFVMRNIFTDENVIVTPAHDIDLKPIEVIFDDSCPLASVYTHNTYDIQRSEMMGRTSAAAKAELLRFQTTVTEEVDLHAGISSRFLCISCEDFDRSPQLDANFFFDGKNGELTIRQDVDKMKNIRRPMSARESARARHQMSKQRHNSEPDLLQSAKKQNVTLDKQRDSDTSLNSTRAKDGNSGRHRAPSRLVADGSMPPALTPIVYSSTPSSSNRRNVSAVSTPPKPKQTSASKRQPSGSGKRFFGDDKASVMVNYSKHRYNWRSSGGEMLPPMPKGTALFSPVDPAHQENKPNSILFRGLDVEESPRQPRPVSPYGSLIESGTDGYTSHGNFDQDDSDCDSLSDELQKSAEYYMKDQLFQEADDERDAGLSQSYEGTGDDTEDFMTAREGDWSSPEVGVYGETYGTDKSRLMPISGSGVTGRSRSDQVPISDQSDWSECFDPDSQHSYFYNKNTGETAWEIPKEAPSICVSPVEIPKETASRFAMQDGSDSENQDMTFATRSKPRKDSWSPRMSPIDQKITGPTRPRRHRSKQTEAWGPSLLRTIREDPNPGVAEVSDTSQPSDVPPRLPEANSSPTKLLSSRQEETPMDSATSADSTSANDRWTMYWDDGAQAYYYYNEITGASQWATAGEEVQLSSAADEDNTLEADDVKDSYFTNDGHLRVESATENYETFPPTLPPNNYHGEYLDADNKAKHEPGLTGRERRSLFSKRSPQPKNDNAYHASAGPKSRAGGARSSHSVAHPPALPAATVGPLLPHSPQLSPTNDFADSSDNRYANRSSTVSAEWILSTDENGKRYRENTRTGEWYYV